MSLHHCPICNSYRIQQIHLLLLLCLVFPICVSWLLHSKGKDTDLNRARHRHSWTHFYPHFPSTIKRNKCTSRRNKLFSSQPFLFLRLLQADLSQGQDCLYGVTLYLAWNLIYPMNCRIVFVTAARDQIKKTKTKPNKQKPPNKTHKQKNQKKNWRHQQCWEFKSFLESS